MSYVRTKKLLFLVLIVVLINQFLHCESSDHDSSSTLVDDKSNHKQNLVRSPREALDSVAISYHHRLPSLKSPVYRMKFGSGRLSHFHQHNNPLFNPSPYGDYKNSHAQPNPENLGRNEALQSPLSLTVGPDDQESKQPEQVDPENDDQSVPQPSPAYFTPFISAHALSNLNRFFGHLQENLLALQQEAQEAQKVDEIVQLARRRMMTPGSLNNPIGTVAAESLDNEFPLGDFKQELDSSESLETVTLPSVALTWPPPASRFFKPSSNNNKGQGNSPWSSSSLSLASSGRFSGGNIRGFIDPWAPQQENQLKRTSYYNPSWLWLGLG